MKPKQETNATSNVSSSELPGFESVDMGNINEATLTSEDLESSKKQLWLIKVPYEFDVSKLSGSTVILNGTQDLTIKQDNEKTKKRYESRAAKYNKNEHHDYKIVVPSKTKSSLNVAKDFSGHMEIIQTVKVPMLNYSTPPPPMYTDIPKELKPRWKAFGHQTPAKLNNIEKERGSVKVGEKRKHVEKEEKKDKSPKKKRKKKNKDESGYGSSLQHEHSVSSPRKHKKKKEKRGS